MKKEELVVLVNKSFKYHPERSTNVWVVEEAIRKLGEQSLVFSVEDSSWSIGLPLMPDVKAVDKAPIGQCREFADSGNRDTTYMVGVYDPTNIEHIRAIVRDAQSFTSKGSAGYDMD